MVHSEVRCDYVDYMKETEIRIKWQAAVNTVMNRLLPLEGDLLGLLRSCELLIAHPAPCYFA